MGDSAATTIFDGGQFAIDLTKKVAQYMAEHPSNGVATVVKVAKIAVTETGGIAVGVAVDIMVEGESWSQAVASQAGAWAAGGLVAIGIGAAFAGAPVAVIAVGSATAVYFGNKIIDALWDWSSKNYIPDKISPLFTSSKSYRPVVDPFALDLDGDGVETVNLTSGILFDHNADGVKTGTGWIKSDDGLLVRDLNANGTIDSGRELFGDQTQLANGQIAANGFTALRDLDSNTDGIIDASDTAFNQLKVWRDLNQDGISQTEELQTLEQAGIASINLTATTKNQWNNANTIASTGTYTKTDGTTGTTADVNLAINTATTEFIDDIEVPETLLDLPDMSGSGQVRDLQQAAALSPTLADLLTQYAAATTRETQLALLDQMLLAWADTSGMAGSLDDRDPAHYKVEYLSMGNISRSQHLQQNTTSGSVTSSLRNEDNPLIDETYRDLISSWNDKIHILEAFNGSYFFQLPGQIQEGGGATLGMWATTSNYYSLMPGTDNRQTLVINYAQPQLDLLNSAYTSLRQAVYESLILQTRLKGYLDQIDLSITEDSISLDFSTLTQSFQDKLATDPQNGLTDLIPLCQDSCRLTSLILC